MLNQPKKRHLLDLLWDLWCLISIIGIWPRFIEPNLLYTTRLTLPIANLPSDLHGLKILQFSDLHLHPSVSDHFLKKIITKIKDCNPDLILFTGDFLCNGVLKDPKRLLPFLNQIRAKYGCYASIGNHDYESCVTVNDQGEYDLTQQGTADIAKGFRRLFSPLKLKKRTTDRAKKVQIHPELKALLNESSFKLLLNQCTLVRIGKSYLNLCGIGEHMTGQYKLDQTFSQYDRRYPGIILAHNPDSAPHLVGYPGNVILSGHTHGSQVNLPFIRRKFTLLENEKLVRGLHRIGNKWLYVTRGVGGTFPFRWFSTPEIVLFTLERENEV